MTISVRRVRDEDFGAIAEIFVFEDVVAQTGQLPGQDAAFWRGFYRARDPQAVELVAEINGRVVGALGIITSASPRRKHVASFGIGVHPEFHGQGVGSALVGEMVRWCDEWLNVSRIELSVFADNIRAVGLYEKFGFVSEGVSRGDMFRGGLVVDSLRMARVRG